MNRAGGVGWVVLAILAGAARADLNCNAGIEFYPQGPVRGCVLNGHHRIHTEHGVAVTCADGRRLEQHADGTLARCTLAQPARLDGQDCAAGSEVEFAADGAMLRCKQNNPG